MMSNATGSRTSKSGAESCGRIHLRRAPSKISSKKYTQKSRLRKGIGVAFLAPICHLASRMSQTSLLPPSCRDTSSSASLPRLRERCATFQPIVHGLGLAHPTGRQLRPTGRSEQRTLRGRLLQTPENPCSELRLPVVRMPGPPAQPTRSLPQGMEEQEHPIAPLNP